MNVVLGRIYIIFVSDEVGGELVIRATLRKIKNGMAEFEKSYTPTSVESLLMSEEEYGREVWVPQLVVACCCRHSVLRQDSSAGRVKDSHEGRSTVMYSK